MNQPNQKEGRAAKRRIKPMRVVILLLCMIAAVYALLLILQFLSDLWSAIRGGAVETDSPLPALSVSELSVREYTLDELSENESVVFDQSMLLINSAHTIPEGFEAKVSEYSDSGVWMNDCMHGAYSEISLDVKDKFGEKLFVNSAYRTVEEQAKQLEEEGENAQEIGASEHEAGLALDVYVMYYAGEGFLKSDAGKWVNESCWTRGFIIRYPKYGEKKTGIPFEPWHIRYVGSPHAEYIMRNRLTLEEYIESLKPGTLYEISCSDGEYAVIRFAGDKVGLPEFSECVISPDNCGCKMATVKLK